MSPVNQTSGMHLHSAREFPGAEEIEAVLHQICSVTDVGVYDIYFFASLMQWSKQYEVRVYDCISCGSGDVLTAMVLKKRQI